MYFRIKFFCKYTSYFIYNEFQNETVYYTDANGRKQSKIEILIDKKGTPKKLTLTPAQKHHNKETNETFVLNKCSPITALSLKRVDWPSINLSNLL